MTTARRPARGLSLLAALALSTSGLAVPSFGAPQAQETTFGNLNLTASAEFTWPEHVHRGFMPLVIRLDNESDVDRSVEIEASAEQWGQAKHEVRRIVSVPAGERVESELFVPAFHMRSAVYRVRFTCGASSQSVWAMRGASAIVTDAMPVVVVSEDEPTTADTNRWSERLGSDLASTLAGTIKVSFASVSPARAPRRMEAYTSLQALVLDTASIPPAEVLEPVLAWARLGGLVALLGPGAEVKARSLPGVASWIEERFRTDDPGTVYRFGHGKLIVGEDDELFGERDAGVVRTVLTRHRGYVPDPTDLRSFVGLLDVPGVKDLPFRLFIALMILFALAIGPVNFLLVKRTGRPAWLLVTIPLLALVASGGILTYGIFYQGVELKERSETFTVLDQREHRSDSLMLRSFFAGLSPSDGLHPGLGTVCFPAERLGGSRERIYLINLDRSPILAGEFMPVRREGTQVILSERAARARLTFEGGESALKVENGLPVAVRRLSYRAPDGTYFTYGLAEDGAAAEIVPGASVTLEPSLDRGPMPWTGGPLDGRDLGWFDSQPPSTYVAEIEDDPFADRVGLVPDVQEGLHVLLGVLASDASERQER